MEQPTQEMEFEHEFLLKEQGRTARTTIVETLQGSQVVKVVMIALLALLLQIPIMMIDNTISERQNRDMQAAREIAGKWGHEQNIIGPFLTVPFEKNMVQVQQTEGFAATKKTTVAIKYAHFLADTLHIEAKTDNFFRHRGIFNVPVYRMDLHLSGRFRKPDFSDLNVEPDKILWDKATLTILISDPRAITPQATLVWNGKNIEFEPRNSEFFKPGSGIEVPLKNNLSADSFAFSCKLSLQGSRGLFFAPMGRSTTAAIQSNWPDPSFQGNWLPSEQVIEKDGFTAAWRIGSLGGNFSQQWIDRPGAATQTAEDMFGVNFIQPIDTYRMAERSVKYQFLFLALTFTTLWLFEILVRIRVHPLQYLLVGGGMCLFYLLELSLAEQIGFLPAYLSAASAIVLLESFYCFSVLKSPKRAGIIGIFLSLLYGYLYTLLINQDYALLAGSIGLFLLLATIMYLTRRIDWYALKSVQE